VVSVTQEDLTKVDIVLTLNRERTQREWAAEGNHDLKSQVAGHCTGM
jgi:hypothetical protein